MLTDKILQLLDDNNLRDSMGKKGKERIEKFYNIKKMVNSYVGLYNDIISYPLNKAPELLSIFIVSLLFISKGLFYIF